MPEVTASPKTLLYCAAVTANCRHIRVIKLITSRQTGNWGADMERAVGPNFNRIQVVLSSALDTAQICNDAMTA